MTLSIACPEGTVQGGGDQGRALGVLAAFRRELYRCFSKRPDGLAELADAVLCKLDRVHMLAGLSLVPECRRGHGAVYDAVNSGRVQIGRLRRSLAALPFPAWAEGRIRLAADVSNWLRPDAETSPDRLFCHTYARGKGNAQMIPGWPYSFVVALEPGRTSWTLPLDAVRLGPADDATEVTARQVREVVARIIDAGHWRDGDPAILSRRMASRAGTPMNSAKGDGRYRAVFRRAPRSLPSTPLKSSLGRTWLSPFFLASLYLSTQ